MDPFPATSAAQRVAAQGLQGDGPARLGGAHVAVFAMCASRGRSPRLARSGPQDEGWGPHVPSEVQTEPEVLVRQETPAGQVGVAAIEADSAEARVSAPERASGQGDGKVATAPRGSAHAAAKQARGATKAGVTARGSEVTPGAGEGAERDTNNQNSQNEPGMSAGIKEIKKRGREGGGQGGA